jgi:hypothetical protein
MPNTLPESPAYVKGLGYIEVLSGVDVFHDWDALSVPEKNAVRELLLNADVEFEKALANASRLADEVLDCSIPEQHKRAQERAKDIARAIKITDGVRKNAVDELKDLPKAIDKAVLGVKKKFMAIEDRANAGLKRIEGVEAEARRMLETGNAGYYVSAECKRALHGIEVSDLNTTGLPADTVEKWEKARSAAIDELIKKLNVCEAAERQAEENARKAAEADELARRLATETAARERAEHEARAARWVAEQAERKAGEERGIATETAHGASSTAPNIGGDSVGSTPPPAGTAPAGSEKLTKTQMVEVLRAVRSALADELTGNIGPDEAEIITNAARSVCAAVSGNRIPHIRFCCNAAMLEGATK